MDVSGARLFRHARLEAGLVLGVWAVFLTWVIAFSWGRGYGRADGAEEAAAATVMGMPEWVAYGVAAPWLAATVLTIVFGVFVIRDDELPG